MDNKSKAIALSAGVIGFAAILGAPAVAVATGCGLIVREAFRDPKEYGDDNKTHN
jgi:hypothetical protein